MIQYNLYQKTVRVINSCQTPIQASVAQKYKDLAMRHITHKELRNGLNTRMYTLNKVMYPEAIDFQYTPVITHPYIT